MPSARALLVASLLTEPPYGCLGPPGNDRYRNHSEAAEASRVGCQIASALSGSGDWETTTAGRPPVIGLHPDLRRQRRWSARRMTRTLRPLSNAGGV